MQLFWVKKVYLYLLIFQSFYNLTLLFDISQKFCNNASVFLLMFLDKCKILIEYQCVTESLV